MVAFSLDTPYDTIRVLAIRDYIKYLLDGLLKEESSRKAAAVCIGIIRNKSIESFARQITKLGDFFISHQQLSVSIQRKHKKHA